MTPARKARGLMKRSASDFGDYKGIEGSCLFCPVRLDSHVERKDKAGRSDKERDKI